MLKVRGANQSPPAWQVPESVTKAEARCGSRRHGVTRMEPLLRIDADAATRRVGAANYAARLVG